MIDGLDKITKWFLWRTTSARVLTARVFVGAVGAILFTVTEESTLDAVGVTTRKEAILTQRFISVQQRFNFTFLIFQFAVFDGVFPVTSLFLDIEE